MSMNGNGKSYWRSLDELADSADFRKMVSNEFPSQLPKVLSPVSRRQFLKVMGASMALMGLAGCRWPVEEIVPFASRPRNMEPGVPKIYATSREVNGFGVPLTATSYDGRPVKVDGNPDHPMSMGGSSAQTQASILDLYDPDRSTHPVKDGAGAAWPDFDAFAAGVTAKNARGEGLSVLAEPSHSPTRDRLKAAFLDRYPAAKWHEHTPFPAAGGHGYRAVPKLENARVIVCLDDDLLMEHPAALANTRHWAKRRRAEDGTMNRLWIVESGFSVTGGAADHRLPVKPSRIPAVAAGLYAAISGKPVEGLPEADFVARMAADLGANPGASLVTAGAGQPADVHEVVRRMNLALSNVGKTVDWASQRDAEGIEALATEMRAGRVETLLILGGNPVFTAPADLSFADALAKVGTSIHLSPSADETSALCTWHLPKAHYLESWDDVRSFDGTPAVVQPLIRPLYDGRTASEVLARFVPGFATKGHDLVRATWKKFYLRSGDFESAWKKVLHDGFLTGGPIPAMPMIGMDSPWTADALAAPAKAKPTDGMEVVFRVDASVGDGRQANNGWLQEMPDPMTKLTWDNPALVGPADAKALSLESGDHVKITVGDRDLTVPVWVQPGIPAGSVTLPVGNGRANGGRVADGSGFDLYPLRTTAGMTWAKATVTKVEGHSELACTHNHHAIDPVGAKEVERRMHRLIREATLEEYRADPGFAKHVENAPHAAPLWQEHRYDGHRWAMSIDLSSCTGCSACVVACQSENNVPVVGRQEVIHGREMHWIRVDRYFGGEPEAATIRHQPVPCMQCENAPCEQVCPVAATVHSDEGLNDMVYNRCIGTRYCANNCPYKVRRFNWMKNDGPFTDIRKMVANPEVTVRARGVMEKCTYCVQRIRAKTIEARTDDRPLTDGEIVPACAQACPAEAIVFGDLEDENSRVAKLQKSERDYGLLDELYTRPRTRYLARLTNPADE